MMERFIVHKVNETQWMIHDNRYRPTDAHRVIALLERSATEYIDVVWLYEVPLPTKYFSPEGVLEDLRIWSGRPNRATRPIPIPHRPPKHATYSP